MQRRHSTGEYRATIHQRAARGAHAAKEASAAIMCCFPQVVVGVGSERSHLASRHTEQKQHKQTKDFVDFS